MCGIFGVIASKNAIITGKETKKIADTLFTLSESRGKESSGIGVMSNDTIHIYKSQQRASTFIQLSKYKELIKSTVTPFALIGHARLVTNGSAERNSNNQPVVKDGIVGVHNGIIVNDTLLWEKFPSLKKKYDVDTEVLLSITRYFLKKGKSINQAVSSAFRCIEGSASVALLFKDHPSLVLATNTGSLYLTKGNRGIVCFASERYILEQLVKKHPFLQVSESSIHHIQPQTGVSIHLSDAKMTTFILNKFDRKKLLYTISSKRSSQIINRSEKIKEQEVQKLRRCTRCILPETMPFIEFDENGVCDYCRNYQKHSLLGEAALRHDIRKYRRNDGKPDCIVAFSGGRDSSYALHYVKKVLGMHPVAYSYDWGMLTDLGRRNQARMCGTLGVEHILISADIKKKRENIRQNVLAWLKKPDLGTIPLFMAGDKQYFYYANKLRKQMNIDLVIYSENPLEQTDFKYGFCGVAPKSTQGHLYDVGIFKKIQLAAYYAKAYVNNPSYINSSIIDTISAYLSSYFVPHKYLYLFQYIPWNEKQVNIILKREYNWELAQDTLSTWRIGDGTAAFYNYLYYVFAGFTENDTFRSNQIREGMVTRDIAMRLIQEENKPRYKSIEWYCKTIGVDYKETINRINSIDTVY